MFLINILATSIIYAIVCLMIPRVCHLSSKRASGKLLCDSVSLVQTVLILKKICEYFFFSVVCTSSKYIRTLIHNTSSITYEEFCMYLLLILWPIEHLYLVGTKYANTYFQIFTNIFSSLWFLCTLL